MCALILKLQKRVHAFHTKISYSIKNHVHMEKSIRIRRLKMVVFEEKTHSDT